MLQLRPEISIQDSVQLTIYKYTLILFFYSYKLVSFINSLIRHKSFDLHSANICIFIKINPIYELAIGL